MWQWTVDTHLCTEAEREQQSEEQNGPDLRNRQFSNNLGIYNER